MSTADLSMMQLQRMHRVLSRHVECKEMPGLVALVSHVDCVHVETLGTLAFDNPAPMRRDTIFRIASLSKPVTAVAAMLLVEECKLRLDDAIDPWVPELANRRVLKSIAATLDDVVPARRAITLRDLHLPHGVRQRNGTSRHDPDPEGDERTEDWRRRPASAAAGACDQ